MGGIRLEIRALTSFRAGGDCIFVEHPLATGFPITAGSVAITVPNVTERNDYVVVRTYIFLQQVLRYPILMFLRSSLRRLGQHLPQVHHLELLCVAVAVSLCCDENVKNGLLHGPCYC